MRGMVGLVGLSFPSFTRVLDIFVAHIDIGGYMVKGSVILTSS